MAGIASSSSSSSEDLTLQNPADEAQGPASFTAPSDQALNSLLQKKRCELMFELKRLEHGERPVTGSDSRDKVGTFFDRRLHRAETAGAGVANVDDVEQHRPQQVVFEVEGLLQRRSVSSVLNSERFRRSLENVVRSHLRSPRHPAGHRTPELPVPPPPPGPAPGAPAAARLAGPNDDSESVVSDRLPTMSSMDNLDEEEEDEVEPPPPPPAAHQRGDAAEIMRSLYHEELVMEISELVHQQLVSSTLSGAGGFRNRLENLVRSRVAESGSDGRAIQEQILRLPPSNIRRNDFSHLGLQVPAFNAADLDDAVSVISATASATIPYAQTNAAVNRELNQMKSQIAQLANMLRMSLDLQTDIQRSIKQEVAAAINQAVQPDAAAAAAAGAAARVSPHTSTQSRRAADTKCIVCIESDADSVLYRCGHICMCYSCAVRMKREVGTCPACRAPIHDIVRAYRISHE